MKYLSLVFLLCLLAACASSTSPPATSSYVSWKTVTRAYLTANQKLDGTYGTINQTLTSDGYWMYRMARLGLLAGLDRDALNGSPAWLQARLDQILADPGVAHISLPAEVYFLVVTLHELGGVPRDSSQILAAIQKLQQPDGSYRALLLDPAGNPLLDPAADLASTSFVLRTIALLGQAPAKRPALVDWLNARWETASKAQDAGSMAAIVHLLSLLDPQQPAVAARWQDTLAAFRSIPKSADNYQAVVPALESLLDYTDAANVPATWLDAATIAFLNTPGFNHDGLMVDPSGTVDMVLCEVTYRAQRYAPAIWTNGNTLMVFLRDHLLPDGSFYPIVHSESDPIVTAFAYTYAPLLDLPHPPGISDTVLSRLLEQQLNVEDAYFLSRLDLKAISPALQQRLRETILQVPVFPETDIQAHYYYLAALHQLALPIAPDIRTHAIQVVETYRIGTNYGVQGTITPYHTALAILIYTFIDHADYPRQESLTWATAFLESLDAQDTAQFTVREVSLLIEALQANERSVPHPETIAHWVAQCLPGAGGAMALPAKPVATTVPDFYLLPFVLEALQRLDVALGNGDALAPMMTSP